MRIGNIPRARAELSLWDFMLFDDFTVPACRSLPTCTLKVVFNGPLSFDSSLRPPISMPATWRHISALLQGCKSTCCSGKDGPCSWWGQQHEKLCGWSVQDMLSRLLRLLGQKRASKPLFFGAYGKIHSDFNRAEFSPHKWFRGYSLFLHMSFFSH